MAGLLASIVLGSCKHKRKSHEALKVHPQACYSVPSARTQGGVVTRASECVKSQWP